jgi:hypothetical protein
MVAGTCLPSRLTSKEKETSRRIAEADHIRENLHYKIKKSFRFQLFLNKLQSMFTIYKEEGVVVAEDVV